MIDLELLKATIAPLKVDDTAALAEALTQPPRPAIRLRPSISATSLPFETYPVAWHRRGFFVEPGSRPGAQISYAAGDYYIQDAASLLAIELLDARPGERVCDLCASPGGKSTALLEAIGGGWLLTNEAIESRLATLQFNLARHGAPNYVVSRADPADMLPSLAAGFDAVLVDAPCSGQSLVSRGKQSAAAFYPRTVEHCASRQARILEAAAQLVRPGGRLVYSTCTFAVAENELQVEGFLQHNSDWSLQPRDKLQPWQSEYGQGHYRLWPHRHGCGGAYAARLIRNQALSQTSSDREKPRASQLRRAVMPESSDEWGALNAALYRRDFQVFGWSGEPDERFVPFAVSGPEVCFRKSATWFPSYALAMRRDSQWIPRASIELDDHQAAQYVEGHSLPSDLRGWLIATWNGRPLGWCKGDGSRLKNHLPKPARMTKAQ